MGGMDDVKHFYDVLPGPGTKIDKVMFLETKDLFCLCRIGQ
jgi:hypothetical protein